MPIEPVPLSSETARRLELAFSPESRDQARQILEAQCGQNIPGWEILSLEELRITAIEFSGGSVEKLQAGIDVAKVDFRDFYSLAGSINPQETLAPLLAHRADRHAVRLNRGFPAWAGPIVGPIVGMLLALPAFLEPDRQGSMLLGLSVGAVLGLIAGLVMWVSNRKPK